MASSTSSGVASTVLTLGGTPTVFFPLSTAWPSGTDCTSNVYLRNPSTPDTYIAWDPLYGQTMVASARSCLPPQVSSWWSQTTASTFTALGPAFTCPEAYTAVQTAIVASSLYQTFCCPSQYTLLAPHPNQAKVFPSQCTSMVTSGQKLTFLTKAGQSGQSTVTTVLSTPATLFAIPVNGFDITLSTAGGSTVLATSTSTSTAAPTETSDAAQPGMSAGAIAGSVVGALGALALLSTLGVLLLRKRRKNRVDGTGGKNLEEDEANELESNNNSKSTRARSIVGAPKELPAHAVYELQGGQ